MKLSSLFVAATLAVSSLASSAATLYANQPSMAQHTFVTPGAFSDTYLFYLDKSTFADASAGVGFVLSELKFQNVIDINFDSVVFSSQPLGAGTVYWSGTPAPGVGPADTISVGSFAVESRDFYVTINGASVGMGNPSGSYSLAIVAAPIPEPAAYMMTIGGLAAMGLFIRRRRQEEL